MKKLLLIILAFSITKISFCPLVEEREGFDPVKAAETRKTTDLLKRLLPDIKEQVPLSQQQTSQLAQKIDQTYTTSRVSNPNDIKTVFDELERLNKRFSDGPIIIQDRLANKSNQLINSIINQIKDNQTYAKQLNSETVEIVLKALDKMQDRQATVTDAINTLVKNVSNQVLVTMLEEHSDIIKRLNGPALTSLLLKAVTDVGNKKSAEGSIDINQFITIFTNANAKALLEALRNQSIKKNLRNAIIAIKGQLAAIHDSVKNKQIKDLFEATTKITPDETITATQSIILESITDYSLFTTKEERSTLFTILKNIADQTLSIKDPNEEQQAITRLINIINHILQSTITQGESKIITTILNTVPGKEAASLEIQMIIGMAREKNQTANNLARNVLENFVNRKEILLRDKLDILARLRNTITLNKDLTKSIDTKILEYLPSLTEATQIPESLYTLLGNENIFDANVVFENLMRAKIWENPTDIQGKIIPWLADVSDTALLSRMLKSKTSREIKEAVIDELIKNTTPDQALSTFETIINDASADQLKTLLDTFDNLENSIFQLYVKAASHQDNFIKALALIAHTESWSFDKIDRTIFSKITNSEQRAMLLKEIGTPLFTSPRDALGWIKGLENFIATEQRLSPQAIQNISEEQLSIIKDQIDNLDTLNTIDLKDVHTVIAKITKRLSESQTALETSISILTKINTIAEARKKEPAPELIKRIQTKLPIINNVALWLNGVVAYLTIKDLDTISNTAQNIRTILTGIVPALTSQDVKTATEQAVGALETLMNNIAKIKAIKKANTL